MNDNEEKEVEMDATTGNPKVYPKPTLPALTKYVLVTLVSLPLSLSWIRGGIGDSHLVSCLDFWRILGLVWGYTG